jgi:hypothetical protein
MSLVNGLQYGEGAENSEVENEMFGKLVASLREQKEILESLNLPEPLKNKLQKFEETLSVLENFSKERGQRSIM